MKGTHNGLPYTHQLRGEDIPIGGMKMVKNHKVRDEFTRVATGIFVVGLSLAASGVVVAIAAMIVYGAWSVIFA